MTSLRHAARIPATGCPWRPVPRPATACGFKLRLYDAPVTTGAALDGVSMPVNRQAGLSMTLSPRFSLTVGLLATLCLAAIIHILVVLSIPGNVQHSAYDKVSEYGPDRQFNLLPDVLPGTRKPLPDLDPAMKHASCRFQLDNGPVLFDASIPVTFWSIGLFNAAGEAVYSLNNRTAGAERLSMLVLTTEQLSILRQNPPENLEDLIVIETPNPISGFALLRAFVPHPAREDEVDRALDAASCSSF